MKSGKTIWRSPSNIAIVKYWGKKGFQLPANPSISMSLSRCTTETSVEFTRNAGRTTSSVSFLFQGERNALFEERVNHFLKSAKKVLPALEDLHLEIESSNSFPHSAGIASSASSLSSLALCLCNINQQLSGRHEEKEEFFRRASQIARLGSGSASRSVYGGWVVWGKMPDVENSSDDHAIPLPYALNEKFNTWYDSILIVNPGTKQVTSTNGHSRMEINPFREIKFETGRLNASALIRALRTGDEELFRSITENEAASLHAMFLLADPPYCLIKPETLFIIDKLKNYRQETGMEYSFTLDAGPNIHLLYPEKIRDKMVAFIKSELLQFCDGGRWIDDRVGTGPELIQF